MFNILGPPPDGPILDLFAGTGALGIEALSRGAPEAHFVERDSRALASLQRNLKELGFTDRAHIVGRDARRALRELAAAHVRFSWVFMDPPYSAEDVGDVLCELVGGHILANGSVVVIEHDKRHLPPDSCGSLVLADRRFYGDTGVSFFRLAAGLS